MSSMTDLENMFNWGETGEESKGEQKGPFQKGKIS